jgi:sugar phosphate isomerase/epimerase
MRLGIGSYTDTRAVGVPGHPVGAPLTAAGLVAQAAALGVRVAQFADNLPLDRLRPGERDALLRQADAAGITLEVGTRGIAPEHLAAQVALAQAMRSSILRVVIDTVDHHPDPAEVVAMLRPQLPALAAAGVTLAIENHDRFRTATLVEMLTALDSPWVGICLDTVNSFGALEGPPVVVAALAPYTVNLHVKDFVVQRASHQMGFAVEGRPAGAGMLDVPWLLAQLAAAGRSCSAIIELWTPPAESMAATLAREAAWAAQSVTAMRRWIAD